MKLIKSIVCFLHVIITGVMVNGKKSKFETILQKQNTTVQVILIDIRFNSFRTKTPVILLLHKNPQK